MYDGLKMSIVCIVVFLFPGMMTWREQAPQRPIPGTAVGNPNTRQTHTIPKTNQVTHIHGNTHQSQTRSELKSKSSGGAGLRQTAEKQPSSAKPRGQASTQVKNSPHLK